MVKSVVTRNELRRLTKAAREKDLRHLEDWAIQFEKQISQEYEREFERQLAESIDNLYVALGYSLHFSELTKFGQKRLESFMKDLLSTIDNFTAGVYNPRRI